MQHLHLQNTCPTLIPQSMLGLSTHWQDPIAKIKVWKEATIKVKRISDLGRSFGLRVHIPKIDSNGFMCDVCQKNHGFNFKRSPLFIPANFLSVTPSPIGLKTSLIKQITCYLENKRRHYCFVSAVVDILTPTNNCFASYILLSHPTFFLTNQLISSDIPCWSWRL